MPKTKVEVYDKDQLIYPYIESDHVSFSNGMKVSEMLDQSISMPTVIHEDLSFKVGVGDQDVSSAIVDSSVSKMTIRGKTYQNILPEPSTHVLTNNKEMFKVNEGLDPNVEIVDAVSKSAILSGQTKYMYQGVVQDTFAHIVKFVSGRYLDPKTGQLMDGQGTHVNCDQYFKIPSGATTIVSKGNNTYKKLCLYDSDKNYIVGDGKADGGNSTSDIVRQIPSNARYFRFSTSRDSTKDERCYIYIDGVLVATSDVDIECGFISCKKPVLKTTGKNLFDGELELGAISDGINQNWREYFRNKNFIPIKPNTAYGLPNQILIDNTLYNSKYELNFYDNDKKYISKVVDKICITPPNAKFMRFCYFVKQNFTVTLNMLNETQIYLYENGTTNDEFEPYKSNILTTPEEVVLRSLPNGVKDTLNLNTGEYVQRIGEVVLDGSEAWNKDTTTGGTKDNTSIFYTEANFNGFKPSPNVEYRDTMMLCDKIPVKGRVYNLDEEGLMINGDGRIYIRINLSRLETNNAGGFKSFLAKENIKIQCELATPVVKTVDLSSSGNWEKVVLDGSDNENWVFHALESSGKYSYKTSYIGESSKTSAKGFCDKYKYVENDSSPWGIKENCISILNTNMLHIYNDCKTLAEFKQNLKQNPITLWYQTATHQDSTQVKQPIFFKDGHVIQSSGADNSLIPTLDYQAKTSNSYVMDLMKTNTRYTMKAKSASGTFTIDGTSYGAGTNGTFTTPSSMTNKLLVMSNKTNTEVMILEGDVVSKTIPYFKGIKSAFEGEDKIEVLSTGKNLFDGELELATIGAETGEKRPSSNHVCSVNFIKVKPSSTVVLTNNNGYIGVIHEYDKNYNYIKYTTSTTEITKTTLTANTEYVLIRTTDSSRATDLSTKFLLEVADSKTDYEPHKSNSTKIPLLSPLRSLPNGLRDELIIDRMKKKATLIQRVGYTELNGDNSEQWGVDIQKNSRSGFVTRKQYNQKVAGGQKAIVAEHLLAIDDNSRKYDLDYTITMGNIPTYPFVITIPSHIINERGDSFTTIDNAVSKFKCWLSKAPISVVYQLETPVITEVDLEGFPYIYKEGHIFLNSEIAPTTKIIYSINQSQQISASNEDIIRHEKELTYLQKLIAQYVQVDYESVLLSLKV